MRDLIGRVWGWHLLAGCACVIAAAMPLHAGQVVLDDGSRLVGRVVRIADGKLRIETAFAGELTIDAGHVRAVQTDEPMAVALGSGDRVVGLLTIADDGTQRLTQTAFGDVELPVSQIAMVWPQDQPEPTVQQLAAEHEQEMQAAEAEHQAEVAQIEDEHAAEVQALEEAAAADDEIWTARIELGLLGKTGNTESLTFFGRAEAKRTTEIERLLFYLQGRYSEQNGVRDTNEVMGGSHIEVDLTDRWYIFGRIDLEYDEFENLDLRATATAGPGYFWIREPDEELKTRAGIGYQHESYDDGSSMDQMIAELGVEYRKELAPWLLFVHSTTYYPTFEDIGDYRIVMDNAGEIPLSSDRRWKLKLGVKNEYDAMPVSGVERMDTTYYANFVLDFN